MKSENTPSKTSIAPGEEIKLSTRFGSMSRGKCWGKYYPGQTRAKGEFQWCDKSGGTLILPGPGYYVVGSDDGFSRKAKGEFHLAKKVKYADMDDAEKIEYHENLVKVSLTRDQEEILTMSSNDAGFSKGDKVRRADLITARLAEIAKLKGESSKTPEQQKAEEAMLG